MFQKRVVLRAQTVTVGLINTLTLSPVSHYRSCGLTSDCVTDVCFTTQPSQHRQVNCNIPSGFKFNLKQNKNPLQPETGAYANVGIYRLRSSQNSIQCAHKSPLVFINIIKVIYWAYTRGTHAQDGSCALKLLKRCRTEPRRSQTKVGRH